MRCGDFDLPRKRHVVARLSNAKHRALVDVTQCQRDDLAAQCFRLIGRHASEFKYCFYPLPNHAHTGVLEGARKVRKAPAVCDDQTI
jgi:hypothetical protein